VIIQHQTVTHCNRQTDRHCKLYTMRETLLKQTNRRHHVYTLLLLYKIATTYYKHRQQTFDCEMFDFQTGANSIANSERIKGRYL